ncbi:MAG: tRNA uridine-5-carboxymethylaminomethyl(34) synthesis GTPase MnmE [bacterium]|nr:MAG: tRNA uridine-5-carboxymethylaminomethyl(34) synthesis GTPase MnmE [bacterium]
MTRPDAKARRAALAMTTAQHLDTIAAISTPPGHGGVGMVRIAGPRARDVLRAIFTPASGPDGGPVPRRATLGHVHPPRRPSEPIDQAVTVFFQAPRSFTGEDTVEITAHGGPLIMAGILSAAVQAGARLAEPGEFTRRSFLNGRMDLCQAEAVASLIFASTEEARQVMLRQVEGAMGRDAAAMRSHLVDAKTLLEAAIDFPEEVEEVDTGRLAGSLRAALTASEELLRTAREGIALREGLRVVIAGAPNVGKSSLLNALLEEERSIVHEIAGTTRDYVEGVISVEGVPMRVVDTAGLRTGAGPVEEEGARRTRRLMEGADLLIMVLDGTRPMSREEERLLQSTAGAPRVVVANKADLPRAAGFVEPDGTIIASALTGQGVEELRKEIHRVFTGGSRALEAAGGVVTSLRQAEALERIRSGCSRALEALEGGGPCLSGAAEPELLAVDVDDALAGVGELTGEVTAEEILGEIFSRFCIGK